MKVIVIKKRENKSDRNEGILVKKISPYQNASIYFYYWWYFWDSSTYYPDIINRDFPWECIRNLFFGDIIFYYYWHVVKGFEEIEIDKGWRYKK
jgi:hypothetical protein